MTDDDRDPQLVVEPATADDLPAVLEIYRRSFADSMGVALGPRYNLRFLDRYLQDPGRVFLVARTERGGPARGFVACRPVDEVTKDDRALAVTAALGALSHPGILVRADFRGEVKRRLRNLGGASPPGPDLPAPTISCVAIGVDPGQQSRGAGRALMEALFDEARRRDYKSVRLTTYRDNPARRLWERLGGTAAEHPTNPAVLYYYWLP